MNLFERHNATEMIELLGVDPGTCCMQTEYGETCFHLDPEEGYWLNRTYQHSPMYPHINNDHRALMLRRLLDHHSHEMSEQARQRILAVLLENSDV